MARQLGERVHYGNSPIAAEDGWQARAAEEDIPAFVIAFCELHSMVCRMSVQDDHAQQIYMVCVVEIHRPMPGSAGFYFPADGTPAELVEDFQQWSNVYG